jgi:DNA-binding response OmpR family regulator
MTAPLLCLVDPPLFFIAEDDEDDLYFLRSALKESCNVRLRSFTNGKSLMTYFRSSESVQELPSLIILDVNMPFMDGKDTLVHLSKHSFPEKVPVCMLSTSDNPRDKEFCFTNGATWFFKKPVSFAGYSEIISILLKKWIAPSEVQ